MLYAAHNDYITGLLSAEELYQHQVGVQNGRNWNSYQVI